VLGTTPAPFFGTALHETEGGTKDIVARTRLENLSENIVYPGTTASPDGTGTPKSQCLG